MKGKGVRTTHPRYNEMLPLWTRCDDAANGEHKIHAGTTTYLPKLAEETDDDYKSRLKRTPFFNATWRTISGLKGMIFRKPPVRVAPAGIEQYLEDVDMAGTPLDVFAQQVTKDVLTLARCGLLVDHPAMPINEDGSSLTVAQAQRIGLRPMMQRYEAKNIINWKTGRVNNAIALTLVVLQEQADLEGDDEFAQDSEEKYRVLDLINGQYRQRVFRINEKKEDVQVGEDIFPLMNNRPMDAIPFFFVGVDDLKADPDSPPLLDLVDMNLHHFTVSADWEHGCHFSGLPTLFISGYRADADSPKIYIGGSSANCLPDPNAKAMYAEVEGNFEGLRNNLDAKKAEMAVLGARMLEGQKSAVESHETLQQRSAGEQSQLAAMADVVSMGMTKALTLFAQWAGQTGEVSYTLNKDYVPGGFTAQDLTALVTSWQSGAISDQVLFYNLQKGELIDGDITFEEEQERKASQAPALIAPMEAA